LPHQSNSSPALHLPSISVFPHSVANPTTIPSTLTTLGLSQLDFQNQSIRYARVLAQPTSRKKALLVGINQYRNNQGSGFDDLKGCLSDVELQQRLLINRFGFHPDDIVILTDNTPDKPTRDNILNAFENHLIQGTQPGDVVVFHFSGHGSRVTDPNPRRASSGAFIDRNGTIVPSNPTPSTEAPDIMGTTLFLLTSAIDTENVTIVLDSCYSGGGTRGNCRVRSGDGNSGQPSAAELAYQERWLTQLNITPEELVQRRTHSVAKGVFLASARPEQQAFDATFDQFDAGVFTCFLTQHLWQSNSTVATAIASTNLSIVNAEYTQNPISDVKVGSGFEQKPVYFVEGVAATPPAEAVIIDRQGTRGTVWLGGIAPAQLIAFDQGATFTLVGASESRPIQILSRQGLYAEVALPPGLSEQTNLLQESARVIPADLTLRIGLDRSLGTEQTTAQNQLQNIRRIEPVLSQSGNTPYPGEIQYILTRMTPEYQSAFPTNANLPINSIGLLSQSLDEVIPSSFGAVNESVEAAIARLSSKLTSLLAARIIKLTLNAKSSRLNLEANMQLTATGTLLLGDVFTVRSGTTPTISASVPTRQLKVKETFQFEITNRESTDLYLSILVVDSSGDLTLLLPNHYADSESSTLIPARQTHIIPNPQSEVVFAAIEPGKAEALIIASRSPLRQALNALRNLAHEQNQDTSRSGAFVTPSVEAIGDLLADLSSDRGGSSAMNRSSIQVSEIAALSIAFEVV
jgi:hypothetical protein